MAFNPNQPRAKNGEWDSAGGAAGSHAAGVNQVGRPAVTPKALSLIRRAPNGISVTPQGETPKGGYMVSVPGSRIISAREDPQHVIDEFARANAEALKTPGTYIGSWKNAGKNYFDVSHNISDRNAAIQAGRARNQIAIFDVKRGREISTGGTGK